MMRYMLFCMLLCSGCFNAQLTSTRSASVYVAPAPVPTTTPAAPRDPSIVSITNCTTSWSIYTFATQITLYDTGDKDITCSVNGTMSATYSWSAGSHDANVETCDVNFDVDTPTGGYWYWGYGSTKSAYYVDPGSGSNGASVAYAPTDCSVN